MRCVNCGTEFADGSAQCPVCGAAAYIQQPYGGQYQQNVQQPYGGQYQQNVQQTYGAQYQQNMQRPYGAQYQQNVQQPYGAQYQQNMQQPAALAPKMKWYKFTANVQLIFWAVFSFIEAFAYITGSIYGFDRDRMYQLYSAMKAFDVFIGILLIIFSAFSVYTCVSLKRFKINGPLCLHVLNGLCILVILLLKIVPRSIIAHAPVLGLDMANIGALLLVFIYMLADIDYFNKRKHMFIN